MISCVCGYLDIMPVSLTRGCVDAFSQNAVLLPAVLHPQYCHLFTNGATTRLKKVLHCCIVSLFFHLNVKAVLHCFILRLGHSKANLSCLSTPTEGGGA